MYTNLNQNEINIKEIYHKWLHRRKIWSEEEKYKFTIGNKTMSFSKLAEFIGSKKTS